MTSPGAINQGNSTPDSTALIKHLLVQPSTFLSHHATTLTKLIIEQNASPAQIGAFLVALQYTKKDTEAEYVAAVASALRDGCVQVRAMDGCDGVLDDCVDIVGTGGDGQDTFNVSTAASIVAAGCGVKVAKHGNRASSSKCGSADVLEALGCNLLAVGPSEVPILLRDHSFCFLFAQRYHPAMRMVAGPRRELGVKTIFNLLGPMINPARPKRMIVGVYSKSVGPLMAQALLLSGVERGMVVCGDEGLDEISIAGPTHTWTFSITSPKPIYKVISPSDFGLSTHHLSEVTGGDPLHNAGVMMELLKGEMTEGNAMLDFVLLNASALLVVAGKCDGYVEGVKMCRESLKNGRALKAIMGFKNALI